MIKGNESDVANIVFEIDKESVQIPLKSVTRYPMGFASKCRIFKLPESGVKIPKKKNLRHATHFP